MTAPAIGGTTGRTRTESTNDVLAIIRAALLDYSNGNGDGARDIIGERLYIDAAPSGGTSLSFPYGVMTAAFGDSPGNFRLRQNVELEVQLHGKPQRAREALNDLADLFDAAMLTFLHSSSGLAFCTGRTRSAMPAGGAPVDSEVVTIRLQYSLVVWPASLASLTRVLT